MNLDEGLSSLDPAFASSRNPLWMTAQLFNGLVELDSQLRVRPALARSWQLSPDGLTYTFRLRQGVLFHQDPAFGAAGSRALRAEDFVYSFTRICDSSLASPGFWIFNGKLEGLDEFRAGRTGQIRGLQAPDDSTLVVRLRQPFPPFLTLLAMPYAAAVPREAVEYYGSRFRAHPVGTGPFRFFRWQEGQQLVLHRNPDYFEAGLPRLDAVSVSFIPSRLSAFIRFVQGELDFIADLDNAYKDEVLAPDGSLREPYASRYRIIRAPQLNTEYLAFLLDPGKEVMRGHPLADLRVRQALNYAIDREKLVRYLLNGMGEPAHAGLIPAAMPGFDAGAVRGYRYDPDAARRLLAEAGYPGGKGLPELTLHSTQKYEAISLFVQKSLEQLGVRLRIENLQGGALRTDSRKSLLPFWRASWIGDYPDGENYLALFYSPNFSPGGPNTTHFRSRRFDEAYRQAMRQPSDSLRWRLYQQMEQMVIESAPVIPLYYDKSFRMLQPWVEGLQANPMNHLSLKQLHISRDPSYR